MASSPKDDSCCSEPEEKSSSSCCGGSVDRRTFLRTVGAGTLATLGAQLPAVAGPLDNPNFDVNVPEDKKLTPEWIKALFERGKPEVYRGSQLDKIGMPIGGICAGQVNLSGDGRMVDWLVNELPEPIRQGFALRIKTDEKTETHLLGRDAFPDLTFRGEYPVAKVEYQNNAVPVQITLEAFSPFLPLNADDSGLPATLFHFTLKNTSASQVEVTLAGGLENGGCLRRRMNLFGTRRNEIKRSADLTVLSGTVAIEPPPAVPASNRPDIIFEDWDKDTFEGWTVEGTAFGPGPLARDVVEKQMGPLGGEGARLVNSYIPSHSDVAKGKLTSTPFVISRNYISAWIGGGNRAGDVGVNLVVDGKVVQGKTGTNEDVLSLNFFDVRNLQGKQATLEIIDNSSEMWAQVGVGRITFSDSAPKDPDPDDLGENGSTALALIGPPAEVGMAQGSVGFDGTPGDEASVPISQTLVGTLGRTVELKPGGAAEITFIVAWHFPNLTLDTLGPVGRHYATRFDSAEEVARYVAANFQRLAAGTRLWHDTWYDSTLPYWFLDRTFLNVSTLATSGCYRFADGRFYAWEGGPGCCPGTCTHVWQYAHSMARIFPELERDTRERIDLGLARTPKTGVMGFRAEFNMDLAVDGQAGTILRIYREHQMAPDESFLKRNWPKIKNVYTPLFALDPNEEGILDGEQMNTLDRPWYGQISWMSSLYVAAVKAGEQMAIEMGDDAFAARCRKIANAGFKNIAERLFNGEYFFSIPDPKHLDTVNSGDGSYIDQVYGQSWAFQVGLPRILPEKETWAALASLWKYNFSPDAGAYFASKKTGRQFVNPGDAGMIMCTFPRTDWDYVKASGGDPKQNGFAYYFVETWTGNEYQVASHMLWEGMVQNGLAIVRAIHDRYGPLRRNPWNEIECGDHYSRAMASHGAFIGACGFEYHGPQGHIGFAPKLSPENFRSAFIAAAGWGTYSQTVVPNKMTASLELKSGQLKLQTMNLTADFGADHPASIRASLNQAAVPASYTVSDGQIKIQFAGGITIPTGGTLSLEIS